MKYLGFYHAFKNDCPCCRQDMPYNNRKGLRRMKRATKKREKQLDRQLIKSQLE